MNPPGLLIRPGTSDVTVFGEIHVRKSLDVRIPGADPRLILDLGAYTGLSTRWFMDRYPGAEVIAVEPDAEHVALLKDNAPGAEVWACAVASAPGTAVLRAPPGGGYARSTTRTDGEVLAEVQARTPARILGGRFPDLVKMDVEGAEKDVFGGDLSWLTRTRLLLLETHDKHVPGCSGAVRRGLDREEFRYEWRGSTRHARIYLEGKG